MKLKYLLLHVLTIIISLPLFSQNQQENNIVEEAKQYYSEKNYKQAEYLLQKQIKDNPNDMYACWLYGQIAHEKGYKSLSKVLFLRAIQLSPDNEMLKMDFARSLFYSKQIKEADKYLEELTQPKYSESTQSEAHLMLGYINYWYQNITTAQHHVNKILEVNPEDALAKELNKGIKSLSTPYLKLNIDYSKDDQPLNTFSETFEIGVNKNNFINPKLLVSNYNFNSNKQTLAASLGNSIVFNKIGFSVFTSAGVYKNFSDKIEFIGEVELKQRIINDLSITAGFNQKSYSSTKISTYQTLTEQNLFGVLEYNNSKILDLNLLYQHKLLKNHNHINTFGGWVLTKPFKLSLFEFKAGYGYSYSDSKQIGYIPKEPIESLLSEYPLWSEIPGIYNPYFTPKKQEVHSILASIKASISKKFSVELFGQYGIQATNQSPLLFSNQDIQGNYYHVIAFYKADYNPYEIKININYNPSDKIGLGAYYQYQETTFYSQDKAGAVLNYRF